MTTRNTGVDILQNIYYFYDAVGNIVETCDYAQQTIYFSNTMITPQSQYWYDALNRLLKATGRELSSLNAPDQNDFVNNLPVPSGSDMQNYTHHYSYDALGNIQSVQSTGGNGWTRTYNYNTINNYLTSTQVGQDTSAYTYDKHGNIVTMPHLPQMEWDYADRIKKTLCGTVNTWYCYDLQGERVRKVTEKQGGITEERIYLNGYEVYRKYISGEIDTERQSLNILDIKPLEEGEDEEKQTKLVFNHNKKITLAETKTIADGEGILIPTTLIRYQYDNHLGSTCLELDASAAIVSYEEYHPFGTTSYRSGRNETEVSLKRYKYVGKERDEETGLYYYGARYYAAWLCRFVSVDPLQFKYPHYTTYQYAGNKPITYIDLDGLEEAKSAMEKWNEFWIEMIKIFCNFDGTTYTDEKKRDIKQGLDNFAQQGKQAKENVDYTKKIVSDAGTIFVSAVAIIYAGAPLVIAGGVIGLVGGGVKLYFDVTKDYKNSDKTPTTFSGTVIFTINAISGDNKPFSMEFQATAECIEGVISLKNIKGVGNVYETLSDAISITQVTINVIDVTTSSNDNSVPIKQSNDGQKSVKKTPPPDIMLNGMYSIK